MTRVPKRFRTQAGVLTCTGQYLLARLTRATHRRVPGCALRETLRAFPLHRAGETRGPFRPALMYANCQTAAELVLAVIDSRRQPLAQPRRIALVTPERPAQSDRSPLGR